MHLKEHPKLQNQQGTKNIREKIRRQEKKYLILIHNPALILLVPPLMALLVLDHVVDRDVLEPRALSEQLAVACFACARCPGDDDVGEVAGRHFLFFSIQKLSPLLYGN
jgi:hypothetical protein